MCDEERRREKKKAIKVKAEIKAPFISMVISEMSNEEHMFHTSSVASKFRASH